MKTFDGDDDSYEEINKYWCKIWLNVDGQIHRNDDLPAMIYADGTLYYFKDGKRHRDGGLPAVIYADGSVAYCKYGNFHRDGDHPAVIYSNGSVVYYKNGEQYMPKIKAKSSTR